MSAVLLGGLALAAWLLLAASGFWTCRERDTRAPMVAPADWPSVVAVVPARDEADVIARSLSSLAAQDYPGPFRIVLVDDNSSDGTGAIARGLNSTKDDAKDDRRIAVLDGAPLGQGWTGKLWALHQGIAAAGDPAYLWLTDADIEHAPDTLRTLVGIARGGNRRPEKRVLVSFMAKLHCAGPAEAAMVPAFIWFFMMLYPFNWINRQGGWADHIAGAAGGCVLVEREALAAAGGIAAMRAALIDDCTLGKLVKRQGPIWLGLTERSRSIRPYTGRFGGLGEIGAMIARSAYAQLRYNPALLVFGKGTARLLGGAGLAPMLLMYQPILRFYRRSPAWALALPAIAGFYAGCTLASALAWYRGQGGMWKGRAQAGREVRT